MTTSRLFVAAALAIAVLLGATTAQAGNQYRTNGSSSGGGWGYVTLQWLVEVNDTNPPTYDWVALGSSDPVPGCGDTLTIRAGHSVTLINGGTASITQLVVESTGVLDIGSSSSGTLQLCGSGATLTVNGSNGVQLDQYGVLLVTSDATISGSGNVRGYDNSAHIEIGPSSGTGTVTLTNSGNIKGALTIQKNAANSNPVGVFSNNGLVNADSAGTLTISSSLAGIADTSSSCGNPRWRVSNGSLSIGEGSTTLHGDFDVSGGTLNIAANVTTDGLFNFGAHGSLVIFGNSGAATFDVTGTGGSGSGNHYCNGSFCNSNAFPFSASNYPLGYVYCP